MTKDRLRPRRRWPLDLPALPIGSSGTAQIGDRVVVAGFGGRQRSVAARIVASMEPAIGYVLDEAIFTQPAHPNGAGLRRSALPELLGIGSLQLEQGAKKARRAHLNMIVRSICLPILDTSCATGGPTGRRDLARPYAANRRSHRGHRPVDRAGSAPACTPAMSCSVGGAEIGSRRHVPASGRSAKRASVPSSRNATAGPLIQDRLGGTQPVLQGAQAALTAQARPGPRCR
jgi:hypothetical protein